MTLTERVKILRARIKELRQAKTLAQQAGHFEKRADDLRGASTALARTSGAYQLLTSQGIKCAIPIELAISQWQVRVKELRDKYVEDPISILTPIPGQDVRSTLLTPLRELAVKVEAVLIMNWREWVLGGTPSINEEVIGVLVGIGTLREKAERIRTLVREAKNFADALPSSAQDISRFRATVKSVQETWEALAGDGIPSDVISFLRQAGGISGAQFNSLKPNILDWLKEHQLDRGLRIRLV